MSKKIMIALLLILSFALLGCDSFSVTNIPTNLIPTEAKTTQESDLTSELVTSDLGDLEVQLRSLYELALESSSFTGTYDDWLETVRGPQGLPGEDGKSVYLRMDGVTIQWQHNGDDTWNDLFDLSILQGNDGETPTIEINNDGFWVINGVITPFVAGLQEDDMFVSVSFDTDGGDLPAGFIEVMEVESGQAMTLPIPTKEGYIFGGWYVGETVNDSQFFNQFPITNDLSLYAKWYVDSNYLNEDLLNHFYFRVVEKTSNTLTVDLILGGHVETCGFDIKVSYQDDKLSFKNQDLFMSSMIANTNETGTIHYNYVVSSYNIVNETVVSTMTFDIENTGAVILDIEIIQVIVLDDNGFDINNTTAHSTNYELFIE